MKNKKNLLVTFFITLLLFSCKKEIKKDSLTEPIKNNGIAQRIDPENMEDEMNAFITYVWPNGLDVLSEPPGVMDQDYEAEDMMLIMEAALNYGTCHPDSDYFEVAQDTLSFEMDLTRDGESGEFMFSGADIPDFVMLLLDSALHAPNRVSFDSINNPFNIVVDLEFSEFDRESQSSTQTAVVRVITLVGNIPYPISLPSCTWGSNDYWYGFLQNTSHGCNTNSNTTSNCFKEMQKRLRIACRGTCEACYYSNITIHVPPQWKWYPGCIECPPNNTYIYYSPTLVGQVCFSPSDMECYTNGVKEAASFFSDRCLVAINLYEMYPGCPCPQFHLAEFVYGDARLCN